jgi:hypothetical protein
MYDEMHVDLDAAIKGQMKRSDYTCMLKPNVEGTGRPMQNLGIRKMLLFL